MSQEKSSMAPWWALSITFIWIAIALIYFVNHGLLTYKNFWEPNPSAIGDFLAGAFSPLAFFWLVLAYHQQSKELRQNTKALQLQAESLGHQVVELQNSVEQQKTMVEVAKGDQDITRQAFDLTLSEKKQEAKLRFEIDGDSLPIIAEQGVHYLRLINKGGEAGDITCFAISNPRYKLDAFAPEKLTLDKGESYEITLLSEYMQDAGFHGFVIRIRYIDRLNHQEYLDLELQIKPGTMSAYIIRTRHSSDVRRVVGQLNESYQSESKG